ncbi:MAG: hypothetical protein ACLT33_06245 [Lachnospira pectinoschiza]
MRNCIFNDILRSLFAMVVLKGLALNLTVMMMVLSPLYRYVCRMTAWLIDFLRTITVISDTCLKADILNVTAYLELSENSVVTRLL